jgi:hypothetical protein
MGALFIAALNPNTYPIEEAECGCKFLDGTVVSMCDMHWHDMEGTNSND